MQVLTGNWLATNSVSREQIMKPLKVRYWKGIILITRYSPG